MDELPLFPLNTVLFPGMPLPLHIFEPRYREMIGLCAQEERQFGVVLIKEGVEVGEPAVPFQVGTMARIIGIDRLEDGRMNIVTVGTRRFRLLRYFTDRKLYMVADVEPLDDEPQGDPAVLVLADEVGALAKRYAALLQAASEQELVPLQLPSNPEELSYLVGATLRIHNPERQRLLELVSTEDRLRREKEMLENESKALGEFLEQRKGSMGPFSRN